MAKNRIPKFDPIGLRLQMQADQSLREIAMMAAGVWIVDGIPLKAGTRVANNRPAIIAADPVKENDWKKEGRPNPYATPQDLMNRYGEGNIADWSSRKPTKSRDEFTEQKANELREKTERLIGELSSIRQKFYSQFDVADCRDGPKEYLDEIRAAILKYIPEQMTIPKLLSAIDGYLGKLFFLVKGSIGPIDREIMINTAAFFEYWADWFEIEQSPSLPKNKQTPHSVQSYLKSLRDRIRGGAKYKIHPIGFLEGTITQQIQQEKSVEYYSDFKTAKWFDDHTSITGESLRKAVSDGKSLRTRGTKAKKLYSLTDAKLIWGSDIEIPKA